SGEDEDTVVEGFTITGGAYEHGAGMYIKSSSPTVTDCWFVENTATYHAAGLDIFECQTPPTVSGCRFIDNTAVQDGGAMKVQDAKATVSDCLFEGNSSDRGGAIYTETSDIDVIDCSFISNETGTGGGVCVLDGSGARFLNATFTMNTAGNAGGAAYLSGDSELAFVNCEFLHNEHTGGNGEAGGIYIASAGAAKLANCTFTGNTSTQNYDAIFVHPDNDIPTVLTNCIVWANGINTPIGGGGPVNITYSDLQDLLPGQGNINSDPLFVDPDDGDCHLAAGSPCIDAAFNNALPADHHDIDGDGLKCERVPIDLDGEPRFTDDPATDDTGCGLPVIVDMGVYEFAGVPADVVYGDVDVSGTVDLDDIYGVLDDWGACDGCCLGDVNADGSVDIDDVFAVLGAWGPCP
ncbi:MAG: right-handed parallel beta-helix repeat-containing protein, partial [Phycisphaerales bacterium]